MKGFQKNWTEIDMQLKNAEFMGEDRIFPLLMKLSIPAIIAMTVMALYNVVDTIFVGRGAGPLAIAGLAVVFPIQMIVGSLGQMIGIGASSILSRKLGEGDKEKAEATLGTAFFSVALVAVVFSLLVGIFATDILDLFGATDEIMPFASDYLTILVWGFPLFVFSMSTNSLIRAEGNAKMAMKTMLIGVGLNIILDPVFIFGLDMGIRGAAVATVISQVCSFVWIAFYYLMKRSVVSLKREHFRIDLPLFKEMIILGVPNFVQMTGMSLITMIINILLGTLGGALAVSTYGISMRLLSFIFMPIHGLAQGFQPIAGFNYGAKKFHRVKQVLYAAFITSTLVSIVFYAAIMLWPRFFVGFFTSDSDLIAMGGPALRTMGLLLPLIGLQMISSIYFQAVGKGLHALLLGLSRQFFLLLPTILIMSRVMGVWGIWVSFPISDILALMVTLIPLGFEMKKLGQMERKHQAEVGISAKAVM